MDLMAIRRRLLMMAAAVRRVLHSITSATGIVSFSTALAEPVESLVCEVAPVQAGTGDPSPDNIRPITGWDKIGVVRTGANIWGGLKMAEDFKGCVGYSIDTVSKTFTYTRSKSNIFTGPFKPNTQYTLILTRTAASGNQSLKFVCTDGTTSGVAVSAASTKTTYAHKSPAGKTLKCIELQYSTTGKVTVYYDESGLFEGDVAADAFAPYQADTVSVEWSLSGYKRLKDITFDGNVHYESSVYLQGSDVVTMTITPGATSGMNVFGCYSGTGTSARNFSFYNYQSNSSNAYFRYGTVLLRPNWGTTATRTVSFGAGGTDGFRTDVETPETSFTSTDPAWIGMLPNSSSAHFTGTIVGSIKVGDRLEFIPVERVADGKIGYYDTLNSTFLEPVGSGTPSTSGYDETDPGTVYGGTLNVATGVLTVDRVGVTYDGSEDENWTRYTLGSAGAYAMSISIANFLYKNSTTISWAANYLKAILPGATWGNYDGFISANGAGSIKTGIKSITTVADWRTYLASNNLQVVYKLTTPLTYQLTPTEVLTIIGSNTIWHDANGGISVDYYDTH